MIEVRNLNKSYDKLNVLNNINLKVNKGEVVSIIGASGAGKSTLLQLLGTLDIPSSGQVFIDGEDVSNYSSKQLAKFRNEKIGFVFQFHHLLPEFTALENVCLPGFIGKRNEVDVKNKAIELLTLLGLKDRMEHKPSELSGGEQQRVAVARALINDPSIVFADEPSGNLDEQSAKELHELFFQLRKDLNQTFIIVTHNQDLAKLADRSLVMKDGAILA